MGTRGTEIVGVNVKELLGLLNRVYCDEWLAYYQYWLGAKIVQGPMKDAVIAELEQHAAEELNHASLLTNRIIQLGGTPTAAPEDWPKWANCGYDAPDDPYVKIILEENIKGEQCAIMTYQKLLKAAQTTDPVTSNIVQQILEQELGHEVYLQALQEHLELMLRRA
jgi:bacterioferritin